MKKVFGALKRLWLIGSCTHRNAAQSFVWQDTTRMTWCRICGLLLQCYDEGTVRHNPHREWTRVA